jgi:hypothetical protein
MIAEDDALGNPRRASALTERSGSTPLSVMHWINGPAEVQVPDDY